MHVCLKQTDSRTCVCMHRYVHMHVRMCVYVCMHKRMNCMFMLYVRPNRGHALVPTCLVRCSSHQVHRNQVDCVRDATYNHHTLYVETDVVCVYVQPIATDYYHLPLQLLLLQLPRQKLLERHNCQHVSCHRCSSNRVRLSWAPRSRNCFWIRLPRGRWMIRL